MNDRLKLTAKATSVETAEDKKRKGADGIEWQILEDNIMVPCEVMDMLPVTGVHTTLYNGEDVCLDDCFDSDYQSGEDYRRAMRYLTDAFKAAEDAGVYQNIYVKVVLHLKNTVFPVSYREVAETVGGWFDEYPHVMLAVENNTMLNRHNEIRQACNPESVPRFIKNVRERMPDDYAARLGTVLDTCHALSTERMREALLQEVDGVAEDISAIHKVSDYFRENSGVCSTVHFSYAVHFGLLPRQHGTAFTNGQDVEYFLEQYLRYTPSADLVLEVREDDYSDAKNFEETVKDIRAAEERLKGRSTGDA